MVFWSYIILHGIALYCIVSYPTIYMVVQISLSNNNFPTYTESVSMLFGVEECEFVPVHQHLICGACPLWGGSSDFVNMLVNIQKARLSMFLFNNKIFFQRDVKMSWSTSWASDCIVSAQFLDPYYVILMTINYGYIC